MHRNSPGNGLFGRSAASNPKIPKKERTVQSRRREKRIFSSGALIIIGLAILALSAISISIGIRFRRDRLDRTLISAVKAHNGRYAIQLLDEGANPNAQDTAGTSWTLSEQFVEMYSRWRYGESDRARVGIPVLLLATVTQHGKEFHSSGALYEIPGPVDEILLRALLVHGANPNVHDPYNFMTPLQAQIRSGNLGAVRLLLEHGANPSDMETSDFTPLDYAVTSERPDIVALLVEHGADLNALDPGGMCPLERAINVGDNSFDMVNYLLSRGARPNTRDIDGDTPLRYARECKDQVPTGRIVRLLLTHGAVSTFHDHRH